LAQQLFAEIFEAIIIVDGELRVVPKGEDSAFRHVVLEIVSEPHDVDISTRPGSVCVAVKSGNSNDAMVCSAECFPRYGPREALSD